jgi:hypothetical protein
MPTNCQSKNFIVIHLLFKTCLLIDFHIKIKIRMKKFAIIEETCYFDVSHTKSDLVYIPGSKSALINRNPTPLIGRIPYKVGFGVGFGVGFRVGRSDLRSDLRADLSPDSTSEGGSW